MTFLEILRLKYRIYINIHTSLFCSSNWQFLFLEWTFVNTDLSSSILCWSTLQFVDIANSWWIIKKNMPLCGFSKRNPQLICVFFVFLTKMNVKKSESSQTRYTVWIIGETEKCLILNSFNIKVWNFSSVKCWNWKKVGPLQLLSKRISVNRHIFNMDIIQGAECLFIYGQLLQLIKGIQAIDCPAQRNKK